MTPVRTAGSPDAEEVSKASTFTLKLKTLARARTLQAFATAANWGEDIENHMSSMSQGYSVKGSCIKLLECFYSAISNGLKQMHSKWPQDEHNIQQRYGLNFFATLRTVNILCTELALCRSANWYKTEYAVQEPGIAVKAGKAATAFAISMDRKHYNYATDVRQPRWSCWALFKGSKQLCS